VNIKWMSLLLAGNALLCACTPAASYRDVSPQIPPLQMTQGRVYVYRIADKQPDLTSAVSVDGLLAGIVQPSSFFFIDREPGSYQLATGEDVGQRLTLQLGAGQTGYVRLEPKVGLAGDYFVPVLSNEIDGAVEVLPLQYVGPPLPKRHHNTRSPDVS